MSSPWPILLSIAAATREFGLPFSVSPIGPRRRYRASPPATSRRRLPATRSRARGPW
uniref:Uncharacterized protein n=1 Tax=Arundo donax TaxID=35708 RepID=A0A0A9GNT0_ARUDO